MSVPPQWVRGDTSRQAHVALPPGTVEDEHGRSGFYGPASHLYRTHAPTDWVSVEGPAVHRAFDLRRGDIGQELWPTLVLGNRELSIGWHRMAAPFRTEFKRDADGDELFFVHAGVGVLRTEYGPLAYERGHYLLVPRGTTYRFEPATDTDVLAIEAAGERFSLPDRGPLGRHAVFDPAIVDVPEPEAVASAEGESYVVVVKRGGHETRVTYGFHPCDVIGWKGDLAPLRLHVDDIRPVVSPRFHLPPSVHTTFVAPGFVVCTFAPRPMETDPEAIRLPFFHRNVEYDEVIFYHRGEFMSRAGIDEGMLTFHPVGLHHGPQPGARERDAAAPRDVARFADEVAVMIDSRRLLEPATWAQPWELDGYVDSWAVPPPTSG